MILVWYWLQLKFYLPLAIFSLILHLWGCTTNVRCECHSGVCTFGNRNFHLFHAALNYHVPSRFVPFWDGQCNSVWWLLGRQGDGNVRPHRWSDLGHWRIWLPLKGFPSQSSHFNSRLGLVALTGNSTTKRLTNDVEICLVLKPEIKDAKSCKDQCQKGTKENGAHTPSTALWAPPVWFGAIVRFRW